jgi:hypothetical protein
MQYAPRMAYEFDIEVDPDPPFTDNLGLEIVEFALGYDVDADLVVVMSVMLVPVHDPEAHDLRFGIRENSRSKEWRVGGLDYTKECVDKYIPKEWRAFVLMQVGRAVRTLVDKVKPDYITMETYYAGLEQKALQKYDLICTAVYGCGYILGDQFRDEESQKNYWLFTKRV